jgi:hypothetical protein
MAKFRWLSNCVIIFVTVLIQCENGCVNGPCIMNIDFENVRTLAHSISLWLACLHNLHKYTETWILCLQRDRLKLETIVCA